MSFKLLEVGRFALVAAAICVATAPSPSYAATNVTENVTLTEDTDWTEFGQVTIADGVTLDLNGYSLKVAAIDGAGSIVDSLADYERLVSLESDRSRGFIDLGYKHNAGTKVDFHVQFPVLPANGGFFAYYGARNSVGTLGQSDAHFGGWFHPTGYLRLYLVMMCSWRNIRNQVIYLESNCEIERKRCGNLKER